MSTRIELTDDLLREALRVERPPTQLFDLMPAIASRVETTRQCSRWSLPWSTSAANAPLPRNARVAWATVALLLLLAAVAGAVIVVGSLTRAAFPLMGKIVISAGYELVFIDPATGQPTFERTEALNPTYSPDGHHIAYFVPNVPGLQIEIMGTDGRRERTIALDPPITPGTSAESGHGLSWSADGGRLAFDADVAGLSHVFVVDREGDAPRDLTPGGVQLGTPALSPDGLTMAVRALDTSGASQSPPRWDVWFLDVATGRVLVKVPPLPDDFSAHEESIPSWAADGSSVVIHAFSKVLGPAAFVVSRDGTHVLRLASDLQPIFPYWSPSGNRIAFQSADTVLSNASDVWVVNSDGTGERELALNADVRGWSADGTGVIYSTPSCGGSFVLSLPGPCTPSLYVYWLNRDQGEILVSSTTMSRLTPDYARYGFGGANWGRLP